jgi:chromatin remodeling complex protein RSC6
MVRKKIKPAFGGLTLDFTNCNQTLEQVFGKKKLTPPQMTRRLWKFVKNNNLGKIKVGRKEVVKKWDK